MKDSKHNTLSPETVQDVRPRYVVFKIRFDGSYEHTEVNNEEERKNIYYIGPYPRPLANYIRIHMLHHRDELYDCEIEWAPGITWVVNEKKVKNKYIEYHTPYPIEGVRLRLRRVMGFWYRVCQLLDVTDLPVGIVEGALLEGEDWWEYLCFSKGRLSYYIGPYPVPVLIALRKYLKVLDLSNNRRVMIAGIHKNPQLGSVLDTSVTHEMVQEFSRDRLLMYYTLYNLTTPFTFME